MLFSEVYSVYYRAMAALINKAIDGELCHESAIKIIGETAFPESFISIMNAIKTEEWKIITKDFKTPIQFKTNMPLTLLQKRFLIAISLDPRFGLFADATPGLDSIEPLYFPDYFHYFDKIKDGDPFDKIAYREIFKTILKALKEKKKLKIVFESGKGYLKQNIYAPHRLVYSQKDDKFRLICYDRTKFPIINVARITSCELVESIHPTFIRPEVPQKQEVILNIVDERNALERSMLHFSNFEKITERIDGHRYQMKLKYFKEDETEVLIRILSFGPMVKVMAPQNFIDLIKIRLNHQKKLRID